jgi:hypothetical protein
MGAEARITVSRTVFGQESEDGDYIAVRPFATVPAKVGVSLSRTINLGNYESARVAVSLDVPCYREEVLRIYPKVFSYVADRLEEEVDKIVRYVKPEMSVEEIV